MKENIEWRDIPGYEGVYQISECGKVKNLKHNRTLHGYKSNKGYLALRLNDRKAYRIHQLVAMAFLNHIPNGCTMVVDHIDNNKANNHFTNLRIISHVENSSKGSRSEGRVTPVGISWDSARSQWCVRPRIDGKLKRFGRYDSLDEATNVLNVVLRNLQTLK